MTSVSSRIIARDAQEAARCFRELADEGFHRLIDLYAESMGRDDGRFRLHYEVSNDEEQVRRSICVEGTGVFVSAKHVWAAADRLERECVEMSGLQIESETPCDPLLLPAGQPAPLATSTRDEAFMMLDEPADLADEIGAWGENPTGRESSDLAPLQVGLFHPASQGILRLLLKLEGERIVKAAPEIGYHHRGVEKLATTRSLSANLALVERLHPRAPSMARLLYTGLIEQAFGLEVPQRGRALRVFWAELERIASHLEHSAKMLRVLGDRRDLGLLRRGARDARKALLRAPRSIVFGGTRIDEFEATEPAIATLWQSLANAIAASRDLFDEPRWKRRAQGLSPLSAHRALSAGASGPILRACGVATDVRCSAPDSPWRDFPLRAATAEGGCVAARAEVRLKELRESFVLLDRALEVARSQGETLANDAGLFVLDSKVRGLCESAALVARAREGQSIPDGQWRGAIEAPNGEMGLVLHSDGSPLATRFRVRGPSFFHVALVDELLRDVDFEDLELVMTSLDLVPAEMDR